MRFPNSPLPASEGNMQNAQLLGRDAILARYRAVVQNRHFLLTLLLSCVAFVASVIANTYAGMYATEKASNPVTDIILSNIPAFEVDYFFVYGVFVLVASIFIACALRPKRFPFLLFSLSLFYLVRAAFVSLTHLAPYPSQIDLDFESRIIVALFGGADEFFSGHTGAPFLMALLFWHEKKLRYFFLAFSVFFAVVVLLGHLHYTIDVAAAFFITYGIYHIATRLFRKERELFMAEEPSASR